jgi:tetratricopeptide (TPR) repeat protein
VINPPLLRLRFLSRLLTSGAMLGFIAGASVLMAATPPMPAARQAPSSGAFLAGIVANGERDTAAASEYFQEALRSDPRNPSLVENAFIATLVDGNMPDSFKLAERAIRADKSNALAHVALGVQALKARDYARARTSFERAGATAREPDLTIALLRAWALVGAGEVNAALQAMDRFKENDIRGYRDFFAGLMADVGKRPNEAERRLASAFANDGPPLRLADSYARLLTRRGKFEEAKAAIEKWRSANPGQPYLDKQAEAIARGEVLEPLTPTVGEGAAEVFYGLGALGAASRDPFTAIIYIQFARFLAPGDDVVLMTLAEFFEQVRQNARAAEIYAQIPAQSSFHTRALAGQALALERQGKSDEAISVLRSLLTEAPDDLEAADTLGLILRSKKRWAESVEVYSASLNRIPMPDQKHWALFFGRAIGQERLKQWPLAEADFLKALSLLPPKPRTGRERAERAQVLNYLAYSWVDMHMNIEKSFDMLREAVSLTPEDGAIVDSLGWAYYRLGKYDEAVRELERAILLRAGDATINDHLGDAYWKVGRKREAYFKWSQALGLNPEPEDRVKIERKLASGLDEPPTAAVPEALAPGAPKPNGG